jgi:hypothetical protein
VSKDFPIAHCNHHVAQVMQLPYQVQFRQGGPRIGYINALILLKTIFVIYLHRYGFSFFNWAL